MISINNYYSIIIHGYMIMLPLILWNILGDIVTEIKMTVGQGGAKEKLEGGRDIIRVPPPVDISSAPSHALAGMKWSLNLSVLI